MFYGNLIVPWDIEFKERKMLIAGGVFQRSFRIKTFVLRAHWDYMEEWGEADAVRK